MGGGFAVVRKLLMCGKRSLISPSEEESSVPEGRIRVVRGGPRTDKPPGLTVQACWILTRAGANLSPARGPPLRVVVGKAKSEEAVVEMEAHYLNHPLMEKLLSLTREEYGYSYVGALRIACDIHLFRYLLQQLDGRNPSAHYMDLPDLISNFSKSSYGCH